MAGYPAIAQIMSNHGELAIFRGFRELNVKMLLYLQGELTHLEAELAKLQAVDMSHPERATYHRDWWSLAHSEEGDEKEQWQKVLEIQPKLKAYSG